MEQPTWPAPRCACPAHRCPLSSQAARRPCAQAKRGSQLNGEVLDLGGWRQIKTACHADNASGAIARALDEFFHSKEASEEDNQNKHSPQA